MRNVLFFVSIIGVLIVGVIYLQVFLSKKGNKWYGRILPIIFFIFSLIPLFNTMTFTSLTTESGEVVTQNNIAATIAVMIIMLIFYNIPTVVLLTIYSACREKNKTNKALERMKIKDL